MEPFADDQLREVMPMPLLQGGARGLLNIIENNARQFLAWKRNALMDTVEVRAVSRKRIDLE